MRTMKPTARAVVAATLCASMLTTHAWAAQGGRSGGPPDGTPALQWISVVLLAGDMEARATDPGAIPAAVQQALADVKDLLPFRTYRLYDAGLTGPPAPGGGAVMVRLRGAVPSQTLDVALRAGAPSLRLPGSPASRPDEPLQIAFSLTEITTSGTERTTSTLMSTTVTLGVGETVVVGTSRHRGEALIALLTAVPATR